MIISDWDRILSTDKENNYAELMGYAKFLHIKPHLVYHHNDIPYFFVSRNYQRQSVKKRKNGMPRVRKKDFDKMLITGDFTLPRYVRVNYSEYSLDRFLWLRLKETCKYNNKKILGYKLSLTKITVHKAHCHYTDGRDIHYHFIIDKDNPSGICYIDYLNLDDKPREYLNISDETKELILSRRKFLSLLNE